MGRLIKTEDIHYSNFRFDPIGSYNLLSRQVQVYNTKTSFDFKWVLNKLCKIEGVGFFIIRKIIRPDSAENFVLRGEKITLVGRFIKIL